MSGERKRRRAARSACASARAIEPQRAADIGGRRLAPAIAHEGVVDRRRHRRAARRARGRARRPSPPPASRHWASGDCAASRRTARHAPAPQRVLPSAAAATRSSADKREAGRLTRSSSRAAAQPNACVARRAVADHAVGGVDRLVERGARQAGEGHPEGRRDDAVGEILRQALDRRARDAGLVERVRVAPDDLRHRARGRRRGRRASSAIGDGGDMVVQAALREQRAGKRAPRPRCRTADAAVRAGRGMQAAPTTATRMKNRSDARRCAARLRLRSRG